MDGHPRCRPASSRSSTASGACAARAQVAHLVYSDGLVAVSVFIEPIGAGASHPIGTSRQGGINVVIRQQDDNLVTVLGEVPVATVQQIAHSVARR